MRELKRAKKAELAREARRAAAQARVAERYALAMAAKEAKLDSVQAREASQQFRTCCSEAALADATGNA
eukprot:CAMPEP_0184711220 /NCGR_PEP_ID=MMETSP0314-20130426/1903_1 /TAXON_ID=38298 /ORGANISM="Rhodella maculata, Strain CCMP 736" /LENGTH=68 /DNA_ID=CAMNT_0027173269 /DNA_START=1 /DNA_END=203 /DNA_ORIENTATION=-